MRGRVRGVKKILAMSWGRQSNQRGGRRAGRPIYLPTPGHREMLHENVLHNKLPLPFWTSTFRFTSKAREKFPHFLERIRNFLLDFLIGISSSPRYFLQIIWNLSVFPSLVTDFSETSAADYTPSKLSKNWQHFTSACDVKNGASAAQCRNHLESRHRVPRSWQNVWHVPFPSTFPLGHCWHVFKVYLLSFACTTFKRSDILIWSQEVATCSEGMLFFCNWSCTNVPVG